MDAKNLYNIVIKTSQLELRVPTEQEIDNLAYVLTNGIQKPDEPHFMEESLYGKSVEENKKGLTEIVDKTIHEWNKEDWHVPFAIMYAGKPIGLVTIFSHDFPIAKGFGCSY